MSQISFTNWQKCPRTLPYIHLYGCSPEVHPWAPSWGSMDVISSSLLEERGFGLGLRGGHSNNLNFHSDSTFKSLSGLENSVKLLVKHFHCYFCFFISRGYVRFHFKDFFFLSACLLFSCLLGINKSVTLVFSWGQLFPLKDIWHCLKSFLVVIIEEVLLATGGERPKMPLIILTIYRTTPH